MSDYRDYFAENWPVLQQADVYAPYPNPTFRNPAFAEARFRVLIVRLSPFRDVDRSTPHLFLAQAVRRAAPDAFVDMAFFPPLHDRERFLRDGIPFLTGTQSFQGVAAFDLVLISNAYTLELLNLPYLFHHSQIPVMASRRNEAWPLFILGGSNALASQAVITPEGDAVVDAIFFGEGERRVEPLVAWLCDHTGMPKALRLSGVAEQVSGLWIANGAPAQRVRKAICASPGGEEVLVDYPVLNSADATTARLQINFGCPAFCSFCFEGYDRKPYREVSLPDILAAARRLKRERGASSVDLYSFNFNTHAEILDLILELNRWFDRVSFKSQRVDLLYTVPGLLAAEVMADKRSFTLGIEGISERQRVFLHKSVNTQAILGVIAALLREKIREIKLFYILTGYESEADLEEFRGFVAQLKGLRHQLNRGIRVIFSAGLLVRMPFTPLRYDRLFLEETAWRHIAGPVKSICETNGFEFRMATPWDEYATSQVMALGGTWVHEPLIALAKEGHCYDTRLTPGYWDALRAWLVDHDRLNDLFLGEKSPDYEFALSFVEGGIPSDFLYQQYVQARAGIDDGYCLGSQDSAGHCLGCGACTLPEQRRALLTHKVKQPAAGGYWTHLPALMRQKWQLKPAYAHVRFPSEIAGTAPEWLNAWLLREFLKVLPPQETNLLAVQEALFSSREFRGRFEQFSGETVVALRAWDVQSLLAALQSEVPSFVLKTCMQFDPASVQRFHLALELPPRHFPNAEQQLVQFLREAHMPVNLRRAEDRVCYDFSAKALKKKIVFEANAVLREGACALALIVSPKFDCAAFLRSFGGPPGMSRHADVVITNLTW